MNEASNPENDKGLERTDLKLDRAQPTTPSLITLPRIAFFSLIILSVLVAVVMLGLPEKFQLAMVFAVPALIVGAAIFTNPFVGVWSYYLMEYLRPYTFIPPLRPLRLALLTVAATVLATVIYKAVRKESIRWHFLCNWFLFFVLVVGSTVFLAANNFFAYRVFETILLTFAMFFITINVAQTHDRLLKLIWLLLWIHLYYAIKGIYNFAFVGYVSAGQVTSGVVGSSFIADENDFALALNVVIPFAFFMMQNQTSRLRRFILATMLLIFVLGVVASQSRGGWLGLVAVTIFCLIKSKRRILSFSLFGLMVVAVLLFAPSEYWGQVKSISDTEEATAKSRINYWHAAFKMFLDYPITGVGAGNGPVQMPYYITGVRDPNTQWGRTFHGTLPLIIAETGGLGLFAYLMLLFLSFRILSKIQKRNKHDPKSQEWTLANSLVGAMIGFMVSGTFLSAAYYPQLWTFYAFTVSLVFAEESRNGTNETARFEPEGLPLAK